MFTEMYSTRAFDLNMLVSLHTLQSKGSHEAQPDDPSGCLGSEVVTIQTKCYDVPFYMSNVTMCGL